ncbi:ABC transporter permease [candidate division CSSED10-310 bacterium]|uniref:ABC transporter permease n=1 Tax=candidate division CSSED10-310 bacterium TaxID=2855610 RepID=A0ABV6YSZ6_UNCC1
MIRRIFVVFRKEVFDNVRDRRSLMAAFLFPLIGAVMMGGMIHFIEKRSAEKYNTLKLPVLGAEYAPNLIRFLKQYDVEVLPPPSDPEAAVKAGDQDVVLIIPESFPDDFRASRPAAVQLVMDESKTTARVEIRRARRVLEAYGDQIGRLRLMVRGVDPTVSKAVVIEERDVSTPQSRAAMLLAMLPYFIVLAVFMGGIYIAIDTTAGELERGSLEPLFSNPIARWELLLGKFAATLMFSVIGLAIAIVGFGLVPYFVSTEAIGMKIHLDARVLSKIYLLFLPLTALASAVQMLVASFSRSFKEAQTQVSFLMLLPVIPGIFVILVPFKLTTWMMFIPAMSEQLLTHKLIRGDQVESVFVLLCVLTTSLVAMIIFFIATRIFKSERLFSQS